MNAEVYMCTSSFSLPKYDEDECEIENEFIHVEEGSKWTKERVSSFSDVRLVSGCYWVDITHEVLDYNFRKLETCKGGE